MSKTRADRIREFEQVLTDELARHWYGLMSYVPDDSVSIEYSRYRGPVLNFSVSLPLSRGGAERAVRLFSELADGHGPEEG